MIEFKIPNEFEMEILDKEYINKINGIILFWFDEDKWTPDVIQSWDERISGYLERPVLFLPKSFDMNTLSKSQLKLIIREATRRLKEL